MGRDVYSLGKIRNLREECLKGYNGLNSIVISFRCMDKLIELVKVKSKDGEVCVNYDPKAPEKIICIWIDGEPIYTSKLENGYNLFKSASPGIAPAIELLKKAEE